jgi:hypothetical protein
MKNRALSITFVACFVSSLASLTIHPMLRW